MNYDKQCNLLCSKMMIIIIDNVSNTQMVFTLLTYESNEIFSVKPVLSKYSERLGDGTWLRREVFDVGCQWNFSIFTS